MLDNNLIQSTSSWPFVEVRKLLKDRKDIIKKNNKITFENRKILSNVYLEDVKLLRETFKYDFSEWEDFKL